MITKSSFITNKEYLFPEDSIIITKTNLKGKITFVSPDFISISGYSEEELIGKPHNLIRHPDMPKAAFKDLWDTIEKGLPWNGYVKNRRKNGDYYWVEATVTPIRENGKINGYMSVRKKPSRERIKEAEVLYDKLNRGVSTFSFTKYLKQLNFIKVLFFLIGFLSVIPPFLKRVSFIYSLISGPSVSVIIEFEKPPTIISEKLPFMSSSELLA